MSQQIQIRNYEAMRIIQDEFKKNKTNKITWDQIHKSKGMRDLFSKFKLIHYHQEHVKKMKLAFKKAFKEINQTIEDQNNQIVQKYTLDEGRFEVTRKNKFEDIKNYQTLKQYVNQNPQGVLVSEQLLQFTYKQIQKDIQRALTQQVVKKITSTNKNKKEYYIFPNITQQTYGLTQPRFSYFGQIFYKQLCRQNFRHYHQMNEVQQKNSVSNLYSGSNQKTNQWVPGYADMKKQWLLKNQQKQRQMNQKK